jgi:hypothetical protein
MLLAVGINICLREEKLVIIVRNRVKGRKIVAGKKI